MKDRRTAVAILYQAKAPPARNGIKKPVKPGGYADSGADIAYTLAQIAIPVITPLHTPDIYQDRDWVFPDTVAGIHSALQMGAKTLWLNTVLHRSHPIREFIGQGISIVGQDPLKVDLYDDKWVTNNMLKAHGLPIPQSQLISEHDRSLPPTFSSFPLILKPIRGRGSEGITVIQAPDEWSEKTTTIFASKAYGNKVYVEEFLPGQEITITVMPPGNYIFSNGEKQFAEHWCLPAVKRFNHQNGIAPYNGTVAVINNSAVLSDSELNSEAISTLYEHCKKAASLVNARAPIRIDCRSNIHGEYFLFDLNMKPNMTGASRAHRKDQDSLTALAARKAGWDYTCLLRNMLNQSWLLQ